MAQLEELAPFLLNFFGVSVKIICVDHGCIRDHVFLLLALRVKLDIIFTLDNDSGCRQQNMNLVGGFNPSEKYEFVSWDDEIPNIWKIVNFMFQTTNQVK